MILKAVPYCLIFYFISRKLIDSMMCQTHCRRSFANMVLYLNIHLLFGSKCVVF